MQSYEEYIEATEHEISMAAQVTEQKGAAYYFQRAQIYAMLAMAAAAAKGK